MELREILRPAAIAVDVPGAAPKLLFERIGRMVEEETGIDAGRIAGALWTREQQGSTAVGHGVAIPHAAVSGMEEAHAAVLRLTTPVDWHAFDRMPVDLVVALVGPVGDHGHLRRLAYVSRLMRSDAMREKLRGSKEPEGMYALLAGMAEAA